MVTFLVDLLGEADFLVGAMLDGRMDEECNYKGVIQGGPNN